MQTERQEFNVVGIETEPSKIAYILAQIKVTNAGMDTHQLMRIGKNGDVVIEMENDDLGFWGFYKNVVSTVEPKMKAHDKILGKIGEIQTKRWEHVDDRDPKFYYVFFGMVKVVDTSGDGLDNRKIFYVAKVKKCKQESCACLGREMFIIFTKNFELFDKFKEAEKAIKKREENEKNLQ